jgi:DNA polymerase-3 subunit delta
MVAVKAHQANAFLKSPDPKLSAMLFFGSDVGLIAERAALLARTLAARDDPPGEIVRLDDSDLDSDPDRLAIELMTMPMFGGRKIVRASAGRRVNAGTLRPLLVDAPPLAGLLIVEAGNLKPDEGLRPLFEKSSSAAAIACYGDEAHDLEAMIRQILDANGMKMTADARDLLVARLGADRALSRGEVEKLVLYAHGKAEIDSDDVEAIVGDASEQSMDRIITAAASGDARRAVAEYTRSVAAGESAQGIILATQRYVHRLHRTRAAIDQGRSLDDALRALRPPLHFRQKDVFAAQLRQWSTPRLDQALVAIAAIAKSARLTSALEDTLAERLLLTVAKLSRDTGSHTTPRR